MLKRILSFILCLSILLCSLSLYMYTPVYANSLDSSVYDSYNTIYEGYDFSSVIAEHKSFNFTDKGGKKHAVKYVGGRWMYAFGSFDFINDDTTLNYFLSWYAYKGYNNKASKVGIGLLSLLNSKLGVAATVASDLLESVMVSTTDIDFEYDDNSGLTISSNSVDKLREEIKKQYYESIGIVVIKPWGTVDEFYNSKSFRNMFDIESDYTDAYSRVYDSKVIFRYGDYGNTCARALCFSDYLDFDYLYDDIGTDRYYRWDNSGHILHPVISVSNSVNTAFQFNTNNCIDIVKYDWEEYNPISLSELELLHSNGWVSFQINAFSDMDVYLQYPFVLYSDKDIQLFKSFEAYYNFLHGSQNAYLSSKINGVGEDIQISIDDMNTNISDKMDELIDSINNGKGSMSMDELQNAIDKGLENISGKIDDVKDNTEDIKENTNKINDKLDMINNTLLSILGVTKDIANKVIGEDDTKTYTVSDIIPHFNKCFTAVKNMVLYGTSSFDDIGVQSVDNDVGISVFSADSSYIMSDTGLIDTIGGRDFYKTNSGAAYVCTFKHGNYWGPLLVSQEADSVSYKASGYTFTYNCTVEYASKTWYVSDIEYSMPNYPSQKGFARVLSSDSMTNSEAALLLLKTAGVSDTPVVSPDYPQDVVKDYHNGLLGKFPFSVPYQLYEWLQVLQADPKTPQFTYDYGYMLKYFGMSDTDTVIKFDLSQYDDWAKTARSFMKLSFTLALAVGTYRKFKGEI